MKTLLQVWKRETTVAGEVMFTFRNMTVDHIVAQSIFDFATKEGIKSGIVQEFLKTLE